MTLERFEKAKKLVEKIEFLEKSLIRFQKNIHYPIRKIQFLEETELLVYTPKELWQMLGDDYHVLTRKTIKSFKKAIEKKILEHKIELTAL